MIVKLLILISFVLFVLAVYGMLYVLLTLGHSYGEYYEETTNNIREQE